MANIYEVDERMRGKGIAFDRIRRITGYLTGTVDRWNTAKREELKDRVSHGTEEDLVWNIGVASGQD